MSETPTAPEFAFEPQFPPAAPLPPATALPQRPRRSRRRRLTVAGVSVLGVAGLTTGAVVGIESAAGTTVVAGRGTPVLAQPATSDYGGLGGFGSSSGSSSGGYGSGGPWGGLGGSDGSGSGTTGTGSSGSGTATSTQSVGIVDIDTVLKYQGAEAAGTGMILTSNGEILTNNHVVDGATSITVVVVSTGKQYSATVVGTDPTADVAVIQLSDASGLQTAKTSSGTASVGEAVTAVGNAGGTGGTPSAASGQVTALGQAITASDEGGGNAENLTGLVETNADVQAGDSGGPLYDSSTGAIIGMDTAASSGSQVVQSYAIPIATALSVAASIESGVSSSTIHQGYPGFLGVEVSPNSDGGATVAGVVSGGPAEAAGLQQGDVITAVDGTQISSADGLSTALAGDKGGQQVSLSWTDTAGATHSATVILIQGPAD